MSTRAKAAKAPAKKSAAAEAKADPAPAADTRGGGSSGGLHWNTLPEDRFYSRVARIAP